MYNWFTHPLLLPHFISILENSPYLSDLIFKMGMKIFFGGSNKEVTYSPAAGLEAVFKDFKLHELESTSTSIPSRDSLASNIYKETKFKLETFPYMNNISGRLHGKIYKYLITSE